MNTALDLPGLRQALLTSLLFVTLGTYAPGCAKRATPPAVTPPAPADRPAPAETPAADPTPDPDIEGKVPAPVLGKPTIEFSSVTEVDPSGDGKLVLTVRYPPDIHEKLRRVLTQRGPFPPPPDAVPDIETVVRYMNLDFGNILLEDIKGKYGADTIRIEAKIVGYARIKGGQWVVSLSSSKPLRLISKKRSQVVVLYANHDISGVQAIQTSEIRLPSGAHKIEVVEKPNELRFQRPPPKAGAATTGRAALRLQTKPHLLGAMYKAYGEPRFAHLWVARSVFRNGTGETLRDYRVRYRLAGYSEWRAWSKTEVVSPGQTVVDAFRPLIDAARVQALTSATPVDVLYEYEFAKPDGTVVKDSDSQRTRILPMNEGVFSDLPVSDRTVWAEVFKDGPYVLATFVSAKDPVIQETAALVSRAIGGRGASLSDENATKFAEGLYALMRSNISYETTPGAVIDGRLHQDLKYGRDVLRTKSGTCVNTSIFFASVAEAAGLDAFIILVPGHAYAGIRLPRSGKPLFVETTGCGDGKNGPRGLTFAQATGMGAREFEQDEKRGLKLEVNVRMLRALGVTPPELAKTPDDALRTWGIRMPDLDERKPAVVTTPSASATILSKAGMTRDGEAGGGFTVRVKVNGLKGKAVSVRGVVIDSRNTLVRTTRAGYSLGDYLSPSVTVTPTSDEHEEDVVLFIPWALLPGGPGKHSFSIHVMMHGEGLSLLPSMPSEKFNITRR